MILKLHGHIGSTASALVDGQLSAQEEERAWQHVLTCPGCRRLVEKEGWVKQQLAGLHQPAASVPAPARLIGSLYDVDVWAQVDAVESRSNRRRTAVAIAGAGSVGIAVFALMSVVGPPAGNGQAPADVRPALVRPDSVTSNIGWPIGAPLLPDVLPDAVPPTRLRGTR